MASPNGQTEKEPENGKALKTEVSNDDEDEKAKAKEEEEMEEAGDRPRALHRTTSIFLRNLAPTITKAEVEAMCKRLEESHSVYK